MATKTSTYPKHVNRRIPANHPRVAHFMPYRFNDSMQGIRLAQRRGYDYIDQDAHVTSDGVVVIKHWDYPHQDGFTWIATGRRIGGVEIRVRDGRAHTPISRRPWSEVRRLRSSRFGGTRYYTAEQHMAACKKAGLLMCMEVKFDRAFQFEATFRELHAAQVRTGARVLIMTLQQYGNARQRLKAAHPFFPTVLLAHSWEGVRKPRDWDTVWAPHVDQVWGSWK